MRRIDKSAGGPLATFWIFLEVCDFEVHFGTPFFSLSAPWVPKRAPDENRWAFVGSPGRRLERSFLEESEIGTETEPQQSPEMRGFRK